MAEDHNNPPQDDENSDISPSAMFLEMMRQAALRETDSSAPAQPDNEPTFNDLEFHIAPEESDEDGEYIPDIADTTFIDEADVFPDSESAPNDVRYQPVQEPIEDLVEEPISEQRATSEPEAEPESSRRVPIYTASNDDVTDTDREAKLEAQRVRRLKRRQQRRQRRRVGIFGGFFRTAFAVLVASVLASTVFTWFTDPDFFTLSVISGLQVADATSVVAADPLTPTAIPVTPNWARRIGIVSGHRGPENDPGAVCDDGLTEREINFAVAQLVVRGLREQGYSVDLLDEFDPRLQGYQAAALVSIHANDCRDYGEFVSGYLVARAAARPAGGLDDVLAECVAREYDEFVGIQRRYSLTLDMTDYHTFREIHVLTPAAILELGFMKDDRELLTSEQPLLAEAITNGILCFLNGETPLNQPTALPTAEGITPEPLAQPTVGG